jgi:hypothetical protein
MDHPPWIYRLSPLLFPGQVEGVELSSGRITIKENFS